MWLLVDDPVAQLVLLRRLVDFDLMGSVSIGKVGVDDPLVLWAGGPRSTSDVGTYDSLWVRLVDLPEALQARTWTQPCDATGQASVERTSADADVALPVQALGAAYLGGGNLMAQHRAGLLTEHRAGAVRELLRVTRTGGTIALVNWTPEGFIGQMFAAMKPYAAAPPPGASPGPLWGNEAHVRELFGDGVATFAAQREELDVDRFTTGAEFRDFFQTYYGPTIAAYRNVADDPARVAELDQILADLGDRYLQDGHMPWEYLLVTASKA